ncbi:MAG: TRAP transporter large permease subunit [Oscillospiraceae bacterium]
MHEATYEFRRYAFRQDTGRPRDRSRGVLLSSGRSQVAVLLPTAAVSTMMGPEMVKKGYKPGYTASILAGAGAMGAIIPPSICFVVYAGATGASVTDMLSAGVIPGLLVVLAILIYNCAVSARRGIWT